MKLLTVALTGALLLASTSIYAQDATDPATDSAAIIAAALDGGDATLGAKVFKKCKACHQIGEGAKNRLGPILTGVVSRQMGVEPGYKYSKGVTARSEAGDIWTVENLDAWLTKPKDFIAKTKMSFSGVKKADDRANLIAYLATFPAE